LLSSTPQDESGTFALAGIPAHRPKPLREGAPPYPEGEVIGMFLGGDSGILVPLVALILGILILVVPKLLNIFVALYLVFSGIVGLLAQLK
jgi:hypothetical protein